MIKSRIILLACLFSPNVFAYIDPGSSAVLLQIIFAIVGGAIVFLKNPISSIRDFLNKIFRSRRK